MTSEICFDSITAKEIDDLGFPWRSGTTYHPLQEDKYDPNYYWN